jgi:hypothetical protein
MRSAEGFFINLDRDGARRASMEAQLLELRLPYPVERFVAVDGKARPGCPEGLRPGQYGCWLSHLELIERSLGRPAHLHVVEDDALLSGKLCELPGALRVLEAGLGEGWDLLYLDATLVEIADMYQMFDWVRQSRAKGIVQVCKVPQQFTVYGTHSYVVNGARKAFVHGYLASHLRSGLAIDNVLARGIQRGELKACVSAPFLTSGDDAGLESSVGYEGTHGFLAWLIFRRLCFFDSTGEALSRLAARAEELSRGLPPSEAVFGALCGYRVAGWPPDSRFSPERPHEQS